MQDIPTPPMEESEESENRSIFLRQKGEVEGPFDPADVRELLSRHEIPPSTLARHGEESKWTPVSILLNPRVSSGPQTSTSGAAIHRTGKLSAALITVVSLAVSGYLIWEKLHASNGNTEAADRRESLLQESLSKQSGQLAAKSKELDDLTSKLGESVAARKESDQRVERLQADLQEAADSASREIKKSATLEALSKALASDQQSLRESLLPAIGLPTDIYVDVRAAPGVLKVDSAAIRATFAEQLKVAGFKVVFEPPVDRQYLLVGYEFIQVPDQFRQFASYAASVKCYGPAWQSGGPRPIILFSHLSVGHAGKDAAYRKSILGDAAMFGEMLADCLGKIDRDALTVDYDMLDPDAELAEAAEKLRSLAPSDEKPVAATGTGFIVSPKGLLVTNHHVIEGHDQVEIWLPSTKKNFTARVVASDRNNDLAFLRVEDGTDLPDGLAFPVIAKSPPDVGQTVFTVGFPVPEIMGREPKYSQGVLNAHSGGRDNIRFLQHSIPIQPGNSGGFLVSEGGEVCGIVQSTLNAMLLLGEAGALPQNVNYAIKSERLWDVASAQGLHAELTEGERKPIEAKDALRLSVLITTRVK